MLRFGRTLLIIVVLFIGVSDVRADAVADWNAIAVQATITAGSARPGPAGVIDIAMVHAAIYDAVQAIEKEYQPYYVEIPGATGSPIAATAKAARDVLVNRFPAASRKLGRKVADYGFKNYGLTVKSKPENAS